MRLLDRLFAHERSFRLVDARAEVRSWAAAERPPESVANQCFLHVRSVSSGRAGHVMQFAAADGAGNVVLSIFVRSGERAGAAEAGSGDALRPAPWERLESVLEPLADTTVVVFGRRLQGGFLPPAVAGRVARMDCARERFVEVMRRRRVRIPAGELGDANDARRLVGLAPVRSPDAALRALGLRELWRWMDGEGARPRPERRLYASEPRQP